MPSLLCCTFNWTCIYHASILYSLTSLAEFALPKAYAEIFSWLDVLLLPHAFFISKINLIKTRRVDHFHQSCQHQLIIGVLPLSKHSTFECVVVHATAAWCVAATRLQPSIYKVCNCLQYCCEIKYLAMQPGDCIYVNGANWCACLPVFIGPTSTRV